MLDRLLPLEDEDVSRAARARVQEAGHRRTRPAQRSNRSSAKAERHRERRHRGERSTEELKARQGPDRRRHGSQHRGPGLEEIGVEARTRLRPDRRPHADQRRERVRDRRRHRQACCSPTSRRRRASPPSKPSPGGRAAARYEKMPRCTYCQPQVASLGLTEAQARERGYRGRRPARSPTAATARRSRWRRRTASPSSSSDAEDGRDRRLPHDRPGRDRAARRSIARSASLETTPRELGWTVHAHPTLSEAVKEAALAVNGEAIHSLEPSRSRRQHDAAHATDHGRRSASSTRTELVESPPQMMLIRRFEEKAAEMYARRKIRGFLHLYIGAGSCRRRRHRRPRTTTTTIVTHYREHGHALARGLDPGSSHGRALRQGHGRQPAAAAARCTSSTPSSASWAATPSSPGTCRSPAASALANKQLGNGRRRALHLRRRRRRTRASSTRPSTWRRSGSCRVFLCENNFYGMGTPSGASPPSSEVYKRAEAYDIPAEQSTAWTCSTCTRP